MIQVISILICSFNGHNRILRTLAAIAKLQVPLNSTLEIVFIDNNSIPSMVPNVVSNWEELGAPYPLHTYIENKSGKVAALTKGLTKSKGDYIVIVDDDNELSVDYLNVGLSYLRSHPEVGVLGGNGSLPESYIVPDWFTNYAYNFACGPQNDIDGNVQPKRNVVYGAGMWFRKSYFEKAKSNGFNFIFDYTATNPSSKQRTNGGEDGELCWALIYQGFEVHYLSELRFNHWLDDSKLTKKFYTILTSRKNNATLLGSLYYRVYNYLDKPVRLFWLKEMVFIFMNYFKNIELSKKYFIDELVRNLSNIRLLLSMRSDYDRLVNKLIEFKNKSKV